MSEATRFERVFLALPLNDGAQFGRVKNVVYDARKARHGGQTVKESRAKA